MNLAPRPRRGPKLAIAGLALLAAAQLVPYGGTRKNPRTVREPIWGRESTRTLAARACFDCHSNETRWPWYSRVAPVSWLVQHDVDEGRAVLNFSEWNRTYSEAGQAPQSVLGKDMPPWTYRLEHPEARLTSEERQTLAEGLGAVVGPAVTER